MSYDPRDQPEPFDEDRPDIYEPDPLLCEWYARCVRPAAGTVAHPILGPVPTCTRCADKHALTLSPLA